MPATVCSSGSCVNLLLASPFALEAALMRTSVSARDLAISAAWAAKTLNSRLYLQSQLRIGALRAHARKRTLAR
eukprot:3206266-Pleurochrysis_carterae.AAC.2